VDLSKLTLEDELALFEAFVKSPVWEVVKYRWEPLVSTAVGAALSGKVSGSERDFLAGKANGLKHMMEYPDAHIHKLQVKIKNEQSKSEPKRNPAY
jgi:hypothetical protein